MQRVAGREFDLMERCTAFAEQHAHAFTLSGANRFTACATCSATAAAAHCCCMPSKSRRSSTSNTSCREICGSGTPQAGRAQLTSSGRVVGVVLMHRMEKRPSAPPSVPLTCTHPQQAAGVHEFLGSELPQSIGVACFALWQWKWARGLR